MLNCGSVASSNELLCFWRDVQVFLAHVLFSLLIYFLPFLFLFVLSASYTPLVTSHDY